MSPNGYFVTAKNPNSQYLVEANRCSAPATARSVSDYLTTLLNINPDKQIKRPGDANYEAKLGRDPRPT
ncbi:hypothetical protein [Massilia putida]|uniref:hypothetical protein n=1 Tax=Massilia putida TaxID=1141883 RepID=UPI0009532336|nr:hypothetical protein [Massilia putida]